MIIGEFSRMFLSHAVTQSNEEERLHLTQELTLSLWGVGCTRPTEHTAHSALCRHRVYMQLLCAQGKTWTVLAALM